MKSARINKAKNGFQLDEIQRRTDAKAKLLNRCKMIVTRTRMQTLLQLKRYKQVLKVLYMKLQRYKRQLTKLHKRAYKPSFFVYN